MAPTVESQITANAVFSNSVFTDSINKGQFLSPQNTAARRKGKAMRQSLCFELIRSGQLTLEELGVMTYIYSYSEECCVSFEVMAKETQSSRRTLARIVKQLEAKGVITKRYGFFKRLRLRLASVDAQKGLLGAGMITAVMKQARRDKPNKAYQADRPNTTHHDRPNTTCYDVPKTTYSNTEENIKNKTLPEINLNPGSKDGDRGTLTKGEDWLRALRNTVQRG